MTYPSRLKPMLLMVTLALTSLERTAFGTEATSSVLFESKSYEIPAAAKLKLQDIAAGLIAAPQQSLVITEHSAGLKAGSRDYIVEKNRVLRIFQELVRKGVDPARIVYAPIAATRTKQDPILLEIKDDSTPQPTEKITPSSASPSAAGDFTMNFPSASAVPLPVSEDDFKAFLSSVGQPGHDAVVIEGFTDTVGNVAYNEALGELRALTVFERLVRAGLPPYRVDTQSRGASAAKGSGDSAADRKVVVRWTRNETIAAVAAKSESPPPPPEEPPPPPPAEVPVPKPRAPVPVPAKKPRPVLMDIVPFAGSLLPAREWKQHAKNGPVFGLGLGKPIIRHRYGEWRATLFASNKATLAAKESDRHGDVNLQSLFLRSDYAFGWSRIRPFVGAGFGLYRWQGGISQPSSQRRNTGDETDSGALMSLGLEWWVTRSFAFTPEFNAVRVGGQFNEAFINVWMALRWRI